MKKIILPIVLIIAVILQLPATTWEGAIDASINISGDMNDLNLEQIDRASFSLQSPIKGENPMSISAKAFYEFTYSTSINDTKQSEINNMIDLELLSFNLSVPLEDASLFSLDVGRFSTSDLTTMIFSQPSDGVRAIYENDAMKLTSQIGFTGFLNAHSVSMNVAQTSPTLSSTAPQFLESLLELYTPAAPFVIINTKLQLPQLFANQNFYAGIFAGIDMLYSDHRLYTTVGLNGLLNDTMFYTLTSTLGLAQSQANEMEVSNLTSFELSTFLPLGYSLLSWKTTFATGGNNAEFKTFTANTATLDDSMEYAGNIKTGLVMTLRPIDNLLLYLEPNVLFDVMNDPQPGYKGGQWLFATKYGLASDLQLLASVGQFFPASATEETYLTGELKLAFVF